MRVNLRYTSIICQLTNAALKENIFDDPCTLIFLIEILANHVCMIHLGVEWLKISNKKNNSTEETAIINNIQGITNVPTKKLSNQISWHIIK